MLEAIILEFGTVIFFIKIALLLLTLLHIIFAFIFATQIKSLNAIVTISQARASTIMQILAIFYVLFVVFLFVATLAIL